MTVGPIWVSHAGSYANSGASTLTCTVETGSLGTKSCTFTAQDNLGSTATKVCYYDVTDPTSPAFGGMGRALEPLLSAHHRR